MPEDHWQRVYRTTDTALPWEEEELPAAVVRWRDLLRPGQTALDVGCGRGQNALALARCGIVVDGIDFSPAAISAAREEAARLRVDHVRFSVADVLRFRTATAYDLVFDYSVFHHIHEADRTDYAKSIRTAVRSGGHFGLVCYSRDDPDAAGQPSRISAWGNLIFHPLREEVVSLFSESFELVEYAPTVLGRRRNHRGHCFLFRDLGA